MKFSVDDSILTLSNGTVVFGNMLKDFKSPLSATVVDKLEASGATLVRDGASVRLSVGAAGNSGDFCFKPTYGTVSRYGIVAMASSMDTVNISAKSIDDIRAVYEIISGPDEKDSTVIASDSEAIQSKTGKVAMIKEFTNIKISLDSADEVSLKMSKYILPTYNTLMPAEVYSNMMQYDAIRYGKRSDSAKTLGEIYALSRSEGINNETKLNIIMGCHVLSTGIFENYYLQAAKARTMIISEFSELFKKYDFLVGSADSEIMAKATLLAGLTALSLPNGIQIIGPMKSDKALLDYAIHSPLFSKDGEGQEGIS